MVSADGPEGQPSTPPDGAGTPAQDARELWAAQLAEELQGFRTELHRLGQIEQLIADTLSESAVRLAQIEKRFELQDGTLPELLRQSQREALIRQSYERYLPQHLIRELTANPGRVHLDAVLRPVTILFADFRSFSATVATMHPQDVIRVLNSYLARMAEIIYEYGGSVDKFLGDGFMAIFGSPATQEDDALRAVQAALEIQQFLAITTEGQAEPAGFRLPMGIGINSGDVVIGALGSPNRMDFTAIGDTVNMAARLTGKAKAGQVILGYSTYREVRSKVRIETLPQTRVKGKRNPIRLYLALPGTSQAPSTSGPAG